MMSEPGEQGALVAMPTPVPVPQPGPTPASSGEASQAVDGASGTGARGKRRTSGARGSRATGGSGGPAPRRAGPPPEPVPDLPVALVAVQVSPAHLDRGFEYAVPASLDEQARPGARVKVRFAGRETDGFVLERRAVAEHLGTLTPIRRVVGSEPVLTPEILALARRVADEHAGTLADVLRLAVPPRHVQAEKALTARPPAPPPPAPPSRPDEAWSRYPAGSAFVRRIAAGERPWAAWSALPTTDPTQDWPSALAHAARAALDSGRGALLVVPDHRDVARVDAELARVLGPGRHVRLTADQGPQARYTAWLSVLRGHVRCVVGTRAASYAPVRDLGLVAWWDDGDDLHDEPRAPYTHLRDVLRLRAEQSGAALLVGGFARSVAVQQWVEEGTAREIVPDPADRRALARVHVVGEGLDMERDGPGARAHLPSSAWRAAHEALAHGPVLVQVPRRGYLPSLSCQTCRAPARCMHCHGPLSLPGPQAPPTCRWCGRVPVDWTCLECGSHRFRSNVVGASRTAEELGRAFPGVPVRTSGAPQVLDRVESSPALVISTPGAEPYVEGGYAAVLLLDAWAGLDRPRLDAGEEALRKWLTAAALARPAAQGGRVVLAGVPPHATLPVVEALVRTAPEWFAARELAERVELSLPPAVWMARLSGPVAGVRAMGDEIVEAIAEAPRLPGPPGTSSGGPEHAPGAAVPVAAGDAADAVVRLGPIPVTKEESHLLIRAPRSLSRQATAAVAGVRRIRSARRERDQVQVRLGVADVGPY